MGCTNCNLSRVHIRQAQEGKDSFSSQVGIGARPQGGFRELIVVSWWNVGDPVKAVPGVFQTASGGKFWQLHRRHTSVGGAGDSDVAIVVVGDLSQDVSIALLHVNIIPLTV